MDIMKAKISIKTKILVSVLLLVCVSLLTVGLITMYISYTGTMEALDKALSETAVIAADVITQKISNLQNMIVAISKNETLTSNTVTVGQRLTYLNREVAGNGFNSTGYVDLQGKDYATDTMVDSEPYFLEAKEGNIYISEPYYNDVTQELEVIVSAPIKKVDFIDAVIYFRLNADFLIETIKNTSVGATGGAYIIDKNGYTIAHKNTDLIINKDNTVQAAKTDPSLEKLAAIEQKMVQGESGFGEYTYGGSNKILAYAPIANSDGWSIGINAVRDEFIQRTMNGTVIAAIVIVISILIAIGISIILSNSITKPIIGCVNRIVLLSNGDLKTEVPQVKTNDETKVLANATRILVETLSGYIGNISDVLSAISDGDMTVDVLIDYEGDFAPIKASMQKIPASLNSALTQISQASEQVASGSGQVASGAQALSQGSTEQASSVEELSATINEISMQIKQNAENAQEANKMVNATTREIENGNRQMAQLVTAMDDISKTSNKIDKIIKTIDDIAFQTNILALNAAVEAARAGIAGKGFAVVAEEVRNLAAKSAEAAKDTTALIENAIQAIQNGTHMVSATEKSLNLIVEKADGVSRLVNEIATASNAQATAVIQTTQGIEQISNVVQNNSATAEESAAASEELSGQALVLQQLVSRFRLKGQGQSSSAGAPVAATGQPSLASEFTIEFDKY